MEGLSNHTLHIPVNKEKKILLISDIKYLVDNKLYYFKTQLRLFPYKSLLEIIDLVNKNYPDYTFWWLDGHEVAIVLWDGVEFKILLKVFKDLGIDDKLFFIDNNLGKSNYDSILNRIEIPCLLGFTTKYGFDITPRKFEKKFICLNKTPKTHRLEIFRFLKSNYLDDSFLSYAPHILDNIHSFVFDTRNEMEYGNLYSAYPHPAQTKSFCNIVTESITDVGPIHITEKTDKCFSAGQPFILVSGPYYLKKLKELGFKTFDKWWDESYDLEEDYHKRMDKIKSTIHQIGKLSIEECESIYTEMIPILKHNKELTSNFNSDLYLFLHWWDYTDKIEFIPKNNFLDKQSLF
jgi:hypothetical protein